MMYERRADGTRRFSYDEILSKQQITSFFSRMSKKNKMAEAENWEAKKETEISKISSNIIDVISIAIVVFILWILFNRKCTLG